VIICRATVLYVGILFLGGLQLPLSPRAASVQSVPDHACRTSLSAIIFLKPCGRPLSADGPTTVGVTGMTGTTVTVRWANDYRAPP
jgi:hypothetical protein